MNRPMGFSVLVHAALLIVCGLDLVSACADHAGLFAGGLYALTAGLPREMQPDPRLVTPGLVAVVVAAGQAIATTTLADHVGSTLLIRLPRSRAFWGLCRLAGAGLAASALVTAYVYAQGILVEHETAGPGGAASFFLFGSIVTTRYLLWNLPIAREVYHA